MPENLQAKGPKLILNESDMGEQISISCCLHFHGCSYKDEYMFIYRGRWFLGPAEEERSYSQSQVNRNDKPGIMKNCILWGSEGIKCQFHSVKWSPSKCHLRHPYDHAIWLKWS
jgi:hypothetical protein